MKKKRKPRQQQPISTVDAAAPLRRVDAVDALRGVAIVLMVIYHFCFDLNLFGVIHANFNEERFWLTFRTIILSLFLGLVGASLVLSAQNASRRSFMQRAALLAACCIAVSAASFVMFPKSWIFFGVLHFILVAIFLGRLFRRWQWTNLALGALLVAVGTWVEFPAFNHPWLQWIGLMTFKPITEDYVPLLPWFGVVLIGMFAARTLLAAQSPWLSWRARTMPLRTATLAGRHSLAIYMIHQPLMIGLLYLWRLALN